MLHPLYFQQVRGEWPDQVSIFTAMLEEQYHLNKMCELIGFPKLFRKEYKDQKPRNFGFLIRPTEKEYNDFIQVLDKTLSDNINKDFFKKDLALKHEKMRKDGKVEVTQKGTIQLLDEWLRLKFRPHVGDDSPINEMIKTFKKVRNQRNKPSHSIREDVFEQTYIKKQREIVVEVYTAIRTLRLIFMNHSLLKNYQVPDWLYLGKICNY